MEVIELIDLVSPRKPGKETKGEPPQPSRPNGTRRKKRTTIQSPHWTLQSAETLNWIHRWKKYKKTANE